jgi:serine/threonine protein kinase
MCAGSEAAGEPSKQPGGETVGPYELLQRLGGGAMGTVYKARHVQLNQSFALKLLNEELLVSQYACQRFTRELAAVMAIHHPHVVRGTDMGVDKHRQFLVMEYLEGLDLAHLVRAHGPLPAEVACELTLQAALGLEAIDLAGLVHRDIKPSNLFLTTRGQIKILDLGLVRLVEETEVENPINSALRIMGTGDFIAPEQGTNSHDVDIRADIYSLGCTLYFLLAGHAPFRDRPTFLQKLVAHYSVPIPPLATSRPDLDRGLLEVLDRMVAKSPRERFQHPREIVKQLDAFSAGLPFANFTNAQTRMVLTFDEDERLSSWFASMKTEKEED